MLIPKAFAQGGFRVNLRAMPPRPSSTAPRPLPAAFRLVRPAVHAWGRLSRGITLGVRVVLWDESGRVMLVRHSYEHGWHFPGGGVEHGETAEDAARREAREEAGCDPGALALLGLYSNHKHVPGDHVALFQARSWAPCAARGGPEIAERCWLAPDAARDVASPATLRRLGELLDGAPPGPHW